MKTFNYIIEFEGREVASGQITAEDDLKAVGELEDKIVFDKKENHKGGTHVLYVSGDIVFEKHGAMAE